MQYTCSRLSRFGLACMALLALGTSSTLARETLRFDIDGERRSVLLFAPARVAAGSPVIIVYHGRGDDSGKFAAAVRLHKDWPEAVVVYPRGEMIDTRPKMRGWQYRKGDYANRDLKLTDALLSELGRRYNSDSRNTYAAGFSNGAHFVLLLMAERSGEFAGFAAIGAVQPRYQAAAPPKPLIYLFGRGEPDRYREDWSQTVQALARHQRAGDPQRDFLSCCRLLATRPGGAIMAYGMYNAGHVWPHEGNQWLRHFFASLVPVADRGTDIRPGSQGH